MDTSEAHRPLTLDDIRTAFLLGWSLVELKSRVLITAFTVAMNATILQDISTNKPTPTLPQLPQDETIVRACNLIYTSMKDMLQPEVAQKLYELVTSMKTESSTDSARTLPTMPSDKVWRASVWRTIFNRIVSLHRRRFPESDTTDTIYDVEVPPCNKGDFYLYLYPTVLKALYPNVLQAKEPDYATVGASSSKIPDEFLHKFRLYDVTRRAFNSLTLILTDPEESLIPETAKEHRWWLVQNMLHADHPPDFIEDATPAPADNEIRLVIHILSGLIVRFIEGWDSYLRESFYVDTDDSNSEIELIAYEAGRALATLSWSASTVLAPLEAAMEQVPEDGLDEAESLLMQQVRTTLLNVFNDRDIAHIQRQIFALSTALDAEYYRANPTVPRSTDSLVQLNPELPSASIHAVKHSLTYWQRAVTLLCSSDMSPQSPTTFLPLFKWDAAKKLRKALVEQSEIWQSLIMCQQNLNSFSIEKITQRLLSDFMEDFEKVAGQALQRSQQVMLQDLTHLRILRWFLIGGAVLFVGIIALIIVILTSQSNQFQTLVPVFILILGGTVGFFGNIVSRLSNWLLPVFAPSSAPNASATPGTLSASSNVAQHVGDLFDAAGATVVEAFQAGYQRILAEFDDLNYAVCVADPLVEFFVEQDFALITEGPESDFVQTAIRGSYECLTKIFWTAQEREEEMQNVVRAAFGPIGAFVTAQLDEPLKTVSGQKNRAANGGTQQLLSGKVRSNEGK